METLQHLFPLHQAHPSAVPLAPTQGPTSLPASGTSLMADHLGEAYMVVDLLDTLQIVVVSFDDESMEGFEGYLEK